MAMRKRRKSEAVVFWLRRAPLRSGCGGFSFPLSFSVKRKWKNICNIRGCLYHALSGLIVQGAYYHRFHRRLFILCHFVALNWKHTIPRLHELPVSVFYQIIYCRTNFKICRPFNYVTSIFLVAARWQTGNGANFSLFWEREA